MQKSILQPNPRFMFHGWHDASIPIDGELHMAEEILLTTSLELWGAYFLSDSEELEPASLPATLWMADCQIP